MARMRIGVGLALLAACVAPSVASAATGSVTLDGGRLVISDGDAGRRAYIGMWYTGELMIDAGELDPIPASCARESETNNTVLCPLPAAIRLDLGGGDDMSSVSDAIPAAVAIEVYGGAGNDLLEDRSGEFAGVLDGGPGNDELEGRAGNDVLRGGEGADEITGGPGSDLLQGGDGDDMLDGDTFADPMSPDVFDGGPGIDSVEDWVLPANEVHPLLSVTFDGIANDGRPGEGDNLIAVEKVTARVGGTFVGGPGADIFDIINNVGGQDSTIDAGAGNDSVTGWNRIETINGGPGDDVLEGGWNNDTIVGGPGKDQIYGDSTKSCWGYCTFPFGNDTIDARDGEADSVDCGVGTDTAQVDAIDTVANCENVTTIGGGPAPARAAARAQARPAPCRARRPPASPGRAACAPCWRASSSRSSSARPPARSSRSCAPTLAPPSGSGCAAAP